MILKVVNTGSIGNCYILENKNEALIIEAGVKINFIKEALNFNFSKVAGAIITHEHQDHAKSIEGLNKLGINTYATAGTYDALNIKSHRAKTLKLKETCSIGNFKIMPFDVKHDAADPCGFLISHPETGNILFLTDTFYSPYTFKNLNNIIIEANFSKKIIDARVKAGASPDFLRNRIIKSHMSLETCIDHLKVNDLKAVNNIVLIHLSDGNSDEKLFLSEVKKATNKNVSVAFKGMAIEFNKQPF